MKIKLKNPREISEYKNYLLKKVKKFQLEFLQDVYNNLLKYTPVRTGRLVNGYKIDTVNYSIKNDVEYLWFVDLGTVYQRGQHFVQISYQQTLNKIPQMIEKIKNEIN